MSDGSWCMSEGMSVRCRSCTEKGRSDVDARECAVNQADYVD